MKIGPKESIRIHPMCRSRIHSFLKPYIPLYKELVNNNTHQTASQSINRSASMSSQRAEEYVSAKADLLSANHIAITSSIYKWKMNWLPTRYMHHSARIRVPYHCRDDTTNNLPGATFGCRTSDVFLGETVIALLSGTVHNLVTLSRITI